MRILSLLEIIPKEDIIRIEDNELKLLYTGTPEDVPYKLLLKYIEFISTFNDKICICIK